MTVGEYVTISIVVGVILMLITAVGSYVSDNTIGLKLLIIELFATALVAATCFMFIPYQDDKILRARYREKVIDEIYSCQSRCFDTCMNREPKKKQ